MGQIGFASAFGVLTFTLRGARAAVSPAPTSHLP